MRRLLVLAFLGFAAAGLAVHFTVRDSLDRLAPLFYALPLPVTGALWLAGAILARGRLRRLALLAGAATLGGWFFTSYGFAKPRKGAWKFATWNLQNAKHPSAPLLNLVRTEWPDFIGLIECGTWTPDLTRTYEQALPGYRVVPLGESRAGLMRGPVASVARQTLDGRSRVVTVRMHLRGEWFRIIVVDLDSGIFRSRRAALDWITATAGNSPRTVILGDLNTPLASAHLDGLRRNFQAATEGPHAGFRETWPYGVPLLSLDQIWLSRDLQPRFARRISTLASDHTPVVASFDSR